MNGHRVTTNAFINVKNRSVTITADVEIPAGAIDGNKAGEGRIEKTQPGVFSVDDLGDVGTDDGTPVTDYGPSKKFTGTLYKVTIVTSQ